MSNSTLEKDLQAANLGINTSDYSEAELLQAIKDSLLGDDWGSPAAIRSMSHFNEVVRRLGVRARRSDTFLDLKPEVEKRLCGILRKKNIAKDTWVEYCEDAPWNSGLRARVLDMQIVWGYYLPYITLHIENTLPHIYYAHGVAFYATKVV